MPIIAIDKFGNYYETDPDMPDGTGCKGATPRSQTGDTSLGNAYQKAEATRLNNERIEVSQRASEDAADNLVSRMEKARLKARKQAQERRAFVENSQIYKDQVMKLGLEQGRRVADVQIGLSGFGLSAEGLPGEKGRSSPQQKGALAALGLGPGTTVHPIDPVEAQQFALTQKVAREGLSRVQAPHNPEGSDGRMVLKGPNEGRRAMPDRFQTVSHPLLGFVRK